MLKIVNLIGQKFGMLEVIAKSEKRCRDGKTIYIVKCDCTNEITVRETNLTTGRATSCGCNGSIGESNISRILTENKKTFAKEYTFSGLTSKKPLRYDFAVMNDNNELLYLIEFDGQQHFQEGVTNHGWNTQENFEATRKRDITKNTFCRKNNIPLIRIPYTERDRMTIEMLTPETSHYLI